MIKIGLDLHGVIDENPAFFAALSKALVDAGHEVHILTGPRVNEDLVNQLKGFNISYTHLFSIVDYHLSKGTPITYDAKGRAFMDDYLWDKTKAEYCKEHDIELHLDDTEAYGYFFKTPFARFFSKNKRKYYIKDK